MIWLRQLLAFNLIKTWIRLEFPSVQQITTAALARRLADFTQSQPIVLDARSEAEYEVSHFAEARRVDVSPDVITAPALKAVPKTAPIVVYCSVGYRSARVTQWLNQAGFQDVSNLEGGLFQWANEDRAIVHAGEPTQLVHPYNLAWGMVLNQKNRHRQ